MREKVEQKQVNPHDCERTLKFLDYLRKSQCTVVLAHRVDEWRGQKSIWSSNQGYHANREGCLNTLKEMEKVASECHQAHLADLSL